MTKEQEIVYNTLEKVGIVEVEEVKEEGPVISWWDGGYGYVYFYLIQKNGVLQDMRKTNINGKVEYIEGGF